MPFISLNIAGAIPPTEERHNKNTSKNDNTFNIQNIHIMIVYDNNPYRWQTWTNLI
jgi:hypothetical protein